MSRRVRRRDESRAAAGFPAVGKRYLETEVEFVSEPVTISLPPEFLDAIVARVREDVLAELATREHEGDGWPEWMAVETAARYLDVSPERVRKLQARGELPYYQEGPGYRVFFRRGQLDEAMSRLQAR